MNSPSTGSPSRTDVSGQVKANPGAGKPPSGGADIWTPLGQMTARWTEAGINRLDFVGREMPGTGPDAHVALPEGCQKLSKGPGHRYLHLLLTQLSEYFGGVRTLFDVPLDLTGTPFQRRIWEQLLAIGHGCTMSYGELARRAGSSGGGARAAGHATGQNRVLILVPCHRVVRSNGQPGGYSGGLNRKKWLLQLERGERQRSGVAGL